MKTTDLMIGDWVMVKERKGDDVKDYPIMVHTGTFTDIAAGNLIVEPIKLTPEILKKNFGKPYPRGGFHNYMMEKDETIAFVIEDRRVSAAPDNRVVFSRCPGTYICDVNYVHELQHALRLCGIKKDIVL